MKICHFNGAIKSFDKAIEIDSNNEITFLKKGNCLYNLDRFSEAVVCYDKAIEIDPNNSEAIENRNDALRRVRPVSEACLLL